MESREAREEFAKQALREWKRKQHAPGRRAHPAVPDGSTPRTVEAAPTSRLRRWFGATTSPPTNVPVNNPAGDRDNDDIHFPNAKLLPPKGTSAWFIISLPKREKNDPP